MRLARRVARQGLVEAREKNMSWSTPVACEVCVGMEVTSYLSADL